MRVHLLWSPLSDSSEVWSTDRDPLHSPSKDDDMSEIEKKGKVWYSEVQVILCEVGIFWSVTCFQLAYEVLGVCDVHVEYFADIPAHIH